MRIPADSILLEAIDITVDESMYDKETPLVIKDNSRSAEHNLKSNPDPFLLTKSLVMSGSGRAVVCAVGKNTRWFSEHPVEDLEDDNELTPLQERLSKLADYIGFWAKIAGLMTLTFMTIFLICNILFTESQLLSGETLQKIIRFLSIGVAIVIVAVPEGLPLAVSISMAFSVDSMKKDNLLVKQQLACENLGYITDICTGKTATLTKNEMRVQKFLIGQRKII